MPDTEYTLKQLEDWNEKIETVVKKVGLDCYEQEFEICSYEDMLCYEAYVGMPSHYPHWSYGKSYEKYKTYYSYNLSGLPYEMVINSDPCIAYLMRDNTLCLQILTIAHVYGHNDFFKNNRLFKRDTRAELTIEMFKAHADRVRKYIQDVQIGAEAVERILDTAHSLRFQTVRQGINAIDQELLTDKKKWAEEEGKAVPKRLEEDLLLFLSERSLKLKEWERDLINIVRDETLYFIPQMETKIMNEGWASYWHYNILKELELPQGVHMEFLQRHNMVIRPHEGRINPYYVGFKIFEYLDKKADGRHKIMDIRKEERDSSFLRRYLNQELCEEMNLFSYVDKGEDIVIEDISDEEGWKKVRDVLANSVGIASVPIIRPKDVLRDTLVLEHVYDGRELELKYAQETIKNVVELWNGPVELYTFLDNKQKIINCGLDKLISIRE